jgi:hypothetical protein
MCHFCSLIWGYNLGIQIQYQTRYLHEYKTLDSSTTNKGVFEIYMCSHIDKNMDSKIIRVGEEIREKGV